MDREEALRILHDNMSDATHGYMTKMPHMKTFIVDAMIEYAEQQVRILPVAGVVISEERAELKGFAQFLHDREYLVRRSVDEVIHEFKNTFN